MNKKKRAIIVTVVIGLLLSFMLFIFMTQLEKEILSDYETKQAVISVKEIPAGTWIAEDNVNDYFHTVEVNGKVVTGETVTELSGLYGAYVNRDIGAGEIMYSGVLCSKQLLTADFASPAEMSIRIEDEANGVAGTLRKGNRVNIYVDGSETALKDKEFNEVLSGVVINEAYNSAGELIGMSDTEEKACILTFYVEEACVAELLTRFSSGTIVIVKTDDN